MSVLQDCESMPTVAHNVRDVRCAADNVSLISNVGIWQFCPSHSDRPRLADLPGDSDPGPVTGAGDARRLAAAPARPVATNLPAWPWDPSGQPEATLRLPAAARRAARVTRCQCIARASGGGTTRTND